MTQEHIEHLRMIEALLFAADEPLDVNSLVERMPNDADVSALLGELVEAYSTRGVQLVLRGGRWMFQTAPDLAFLLQREIEQERRLSRAGQETLAIIAYHQPVTRSEIEEIRGVTVSRGTLDVLLETGWVRPVGRRQTPGRPVTYGVTDDFLIHFSLESVKDLPGLDELKAAGLLDSDIPPDFQLVAMKGDADTDTDENKDDENDENELPLNDPDEGDIANLGDGTV